MALVGMAVQEVITGVMRAGKPYRFRAMKLPNADFSGMDLEAADFRGSSLPYANFDRSNCRFVNFEGAMLHGCSFVDTDLHRGNFKNAVLSDTIMEAKDMFGVTVTLECNSFKGMRPSPGWWWGWMFYLLLMQAPSKEAEDKVIQAMGIERYTVLREQYAGRRM